MSTRIGLSLRCVGPLVLLAGVAVGAMGCSDPARAHTSAIEIADGSLRGRLVESIARYDDGTADISYQLRIKGNEQDVRQLVFDTAPELMPFAEVKVWGVPVDGKLRVTQWEHVVDDTDDIGSSSESLVGVTPLAPLKLAMAIVDIGAGNSNAAITPAELQKRIFDNPDSTRAFYLESSYNMQPMTGKVVDTVLSYPMTTCDTSGMATALKGMVDTSVGQASDVYLWYFQGKATACSWSGLSSGNNTYYNASAGCVVLAQEPGHSLGLAHSSSLTCTGGPMLDDPNNGCTHNEYGSPYDVMGGGCHQFTAYHKTYRTYAQKCNVVRVRQSGTFNIFPTEKACNGIQILQVPMPHVRPFTNSGGGGGGARNTQLAYYTVELRAPIGFDTGLKPSVIVNAAPQFSFNVASSRNNARGEHTWLLTLGSGTARDGTAHGLAPGSTFTDPSGTVAITTMAVSADIATIKVDITGATTVDGGSGDTICVDGTPISPPGPVSCGDDGGVPPPPPPPPPMDAASGARDARADAPGTGAGGAGVGAGGSSVTGSGGSVTAGSTTAGTGGAGQGSGGATQGTGGASTGTGGSDTTGTTSGSATTGGSGGGSTTGSAPKPAGDLQNGCSCRVIGSPSTSSGTSGGFALFGLALAGLARRRRRTSQIG